MGALLGEMDFPSTNGNRIRNFAFSPEPKDCSFAGDASKDDKGSSSHGDPCAPKLRKRQPSKVHVYLKQVGLPLDGRNT